MCRSPLIAIAAYEREHGIDHAEHPGHGAATDVAGLFLRQWRWLGEGEWPQGDQIRLQFGLLLCNGSSLARRICSNVFRLIVGFVVIVVFGRCSGGS